MGKWEEFQRNRHTADSNIIYFLWCYKEDVFLWLHTVLRVSQQRVFSQRETGMSV